MFTTSLKQELKTKTSNLFSRMVCLEKTCSSEITHFLNKWQGSSNGHVWQKLRNNKFMNSILSVTTISVKGQIKIIVNLKNWGN